MEGAKGYFSNHQQRYYVPGRFVAVSVEGIAKPIQTQGNGFKTAVRNGLIPLRVVYGNERYEAGMTVWVETLATKLPWAGGDQQFIVGKDGVPFALLPEDYVKLVTGQP